MEDAQPAPLAPERETSGRTGRPFDRSKDWRILAATRDALADRDFDQVTIDAIAAEVGTAKTTIYRRWPTKAALVLAAVHSAGRPPEADDLPDLGSLRADLIAIVDSPWLGGPERRLAVFAGFASAARTSSELADVIRTQITEPYIQTYRALLERALDRGLLPEAARRRIPLIAQVVPALSSQLLTGATRADRDHYLAIVDDIVLPALGEEGR